MSTEHIQKNSTSSWKCASTEKTSLNFEKEIRILIPDKL